MDSPCTPRLHATRPRAQVLALCLGIVATQTPGLTTLGLAVSGGGDKTTKFIDELNNQMRQSPSFNANKDANVYSGGDNYGVARRAVNRFRSSRRRRGYGVDRPKAKRPEDADNCSGSFAAWIVRLVKRAASRRLCSSTSTRPALPWPRRSSCAPSTMARLWAGMGLRKPCPGVARTSTAATTLVALSGRSGTTTLWPFRNSTRRPVPKSTGCARDVGASTSAVELASISPATASAATADSTLIT